MPWRNYIDTIPCPACKMGVTRVCMRYSDVLLVCEPGLDRHRRTQTATGRPRDAAPGGRDALANSKT
jgi:hypothetical protein